MNKGQKLTIGVIIIIAIVGATLFSVGGFTGTTAQWNRLDNVDFALPTNQVPIITGTATGWTISYGYTNYQPIAPYNIQCEVAGQPQTIYNDYKTPIEVDNGDGTKTKYEWSIKTLELGIDFMSIGGNTIVDKTSYNGLQVVLRLENSYASVWLDAQESFGYVTEVWVHEYDVKLDGLQHSILPSAQGAFFELFSVDDGSQMPDPPPAFSSVLDIDKLKEYSTVDIKFTISEFGPLRTLGVYEDAHIYYTLHMKVVVLGVWTHVVPPHTQGPAPDPTNWNIWELIMTFIVSIVVSIIGAIMVVVIPDKRVKIVVGLVILVIVLWNLGFLEEFM